MGWEIRDNFWERTGKAWLLHGPRITVGLNVRTARTDHLVNVDNFYITSLVFIRIFVNEPNCLDSMGLFSVHWVHPLKLRVVSWELYHCRPNLILPKCEDTVQWSPPLLLLLLLLAFLVGPIISWIFHGFFFSPFPRKNLLQHTSTPRFFHLSPAKPGLGLSEAALNCSSQHDH